MEDQIKKLSEQIETLQGKAQELVDRADKDPSADVDEVKRDLKSIQETVAPLLAERDQRVRDLELNGMKAQVQTLQETLDEFRSFNPEAGRKGAVDETPYSNGEASFFQDIALAKNGNRKAQERLEGAKAMSEGTDSAGGYLVTPQVSNELLELRVAQTIMRQLSPSLAVNSDTLQFIQQTGGLTAGWVAELATKPQQDMTFGQISVNVFTAAGLATVSNQLLQDAGKQSTGPNVGIDSLILRELARRLAILEEIAVLNGSGTGQPKGIINESGVGNAGGALATATVPALLDKIVDAITEVQTNYKGDPTHIVMHPRSWALILKERESASPTTYIVGPPGGVGRRASDALPGGGALPGRVAGELFGLPVILSANIPTNLGGTTNESRVIVGDFNQALFMDRQGVTVDTSEHVLFTSNQTIFRAEMRVGFTVARYPSAFSVIGGAGLANR